MILRGAAGRKPPYGRVFGGDELYLIENDASGLVKAKTSVSSVVNSEKMEKDESTSMLKNHQDQLQLTKHQLKRWAGKRYLVLIEIQNAVEIEPFQIDKSKFSNMDDWLLVEDIVKVKFQEPK